MGKPVTLVLDEEVEKKLRIIQARKIKESRKAVSFSEVANDVLKKGLK